MRFWLMLGLAVMCGCDKLTGPSSDGTGSEGSNAIRDGGLPEEAQRIATSQGTITVGDENLVRSFPLPIMPESEIKHVGRIEQPGKPVSLQMVLEVKAPMYKAADYYENAMRMKGLRVRTGGLSKDAGQMYMMGESRAAAATVMLDQPRGKEVTTLSLSWTDNSTITPATSSAPAEARRP